MNVIKMDIDDAQRVNLLAKELKEHGIACSIDEAEQKAKSMMLKSENKKEEPDEKLQLLDQRYKFLLNSQSQRFTEEINSLKEGLASMSSELVGLKRKIAEQKREAETRKDVSDKPKEEVQQKIAESKEKTSEPKELTPEDVSIEKFFYCGEK